MMIFQARPTTEIRPSTAQIALRRFAADRAGNVAMMFALCAVVMLSLVGLAIDFAFKQSARTLLQNSLDAAMLAAARSDAGSLSEKQKLALKYAQNNFAGKYDASALSVILSEDAKTGELVGIAKITAPNFFGGFFGQMTSDIGARSAVREDVPPLEVMLVLDKTGSMTGAKLAALKVAANDLVSEIMDGTNVRIGIVPFSRYVNIGMGLRNEPGFAVPADYQTCAIKKVPVYSNPHNCRTINVPVGTCYNDGTPYRCGGGSYQKCDHDVTYEDRNVCTDFKWTGCVGSRDEPLNARDESTGTPVPGLLNVGCGNNAITRLTLNKGTVTGAINALNANGETYVPAGLMMGWHALSYRPILPDGTDPSTVKGAAITRAIILMTDGANTVSKDIGAATHWGNNVGRANALTRDLCANIKQDGIAVYTIAFDVTDPTITNILRQCATQPSQAYDAADASELSAAFEEIGRSLTRLRLSR